VTDFNTIKKIYNGKFNALTATGRAGMSDKTPLDMGLWKDFSHRWTSYMESCSPGISFFSRGTLWGIESQPYG
jgi:hypothetical protein